MLQPGLYCSEVNEGHWLHDYRVVIRVKETATAFHFMLENAVQLDNAIHLDSLFQRGEKQKVLIKKHGSGHAMRIWSDKDFTLYPYQAGMPYHFMRIAD